jgi:hypothetical protein
VPLIVTCLPLQSNLRCALRGRITDLITGWVTVALIENTPCLMYVSYLMPHHEHPSCRVHPRASQDLAAALYLHKQHTETHVHIHIGKLSISIRRQWSSHILYNYIRETHKWILLTYKWSTSTTTSPLESIKTLKWSISFIWYLF